MQEKTREFGGQDKTYAGEGWRIKIAGRGEEKTVAKSYACSEPKETKERN